MAESLNEILDVARELAERDEWALAAQMLRPIAESAPDALELWLQIAQWETRDARPKDAQNTLRHALECNDQIQDEARALPLWKALAENSYESQQWAQTREVCEHILEIVSDSARGLHNVRDMLATSLAHEGEFEAAIDEVRRVLMLSPRDPLHRMRLASLLQAQGQSGEAVREFERVLIMAPDSMFASDAETAIEALDRAQIQQILLRAGEQRIFGLYLERDMDSTLDENAFYLSESGRETLRQMVWDGSSDDTPTPPRMH